MVDFGEGLETVHYSGIICYFPEQVPALIEHLQKDVNRTDWEFLRTEYETYIDRLQTAIDAGPGTAFAEYIQIMREEGWWDEADGDGSIGYDAVQARQDLDALIEKNRIQEASQ